MYNKRGFTLVELLAVIAILAILVIIALPNIMGLYNSAMKNSFAVDVNSMVKGTKELYMRRELSNQKTNEISSEGEIQLDGYASDRYTYTFKLDSSGNVTSLNVSNGKYCVNIENYKKSVTVDDITECGSEQNGGNATEIKIADKILNDNIPQSDNNIDLKKASFVVNSYISKKEDKQTYTIKDDVNYVFGNEYAFDGANYNITSESELYGQLSSEYKYFCENNYYCKEMYEIESINANEAVVYKYVIVPNEYYENGKGLYYTTREDDRYYYYRGNVKNNYINFFDIEWRIVRINPDKSIRIMMSDSITSGKFNNSSEDSKYIGYMYGDSSSSYESSHENINDSLIKKTLDYAASQLPTEALNYLADNGFCFDRSVVSQNGYSRFDSDNADPEITAKAFEIVRYLNNSDYRLNDSAKGYGRNVTLYGNFYRALYGEPSLSCTNKNDLFTVSSSNGNGSLTYPVGLLTADEAIYAGAEFGYLNSNYYLYYDEPWWTFSPLGIYNYYDNKLINTVIVGERGLNIGEIGSEYSIRPVIDLKPNVLYKSGNGSKSSPYKVVLE